MEDVNPTVRGPHCSFVQCFTQNLFTLVQSKVFVYIHYFWLQINEYVEKLLSHFVQLNGSSPVWALSSPYVGRIYRDHPGFF